MPPRPTVDPLVGDTERELAGLEGSAERAALVHRQFLAVGTTTAHVRITVPRGDLRATATHHESRWIAPLLAAAGSRHVVIDSHAHGLAATEFPASPSEHRLRALWACTRAGDDIRDLPLAHHDVELRRALRLRDARASDRFTEFDGNLQGRTVDPLPATISPTRVETWAGCPHAYFVQYVLGARPIDEPADIETLSQLDRGTAIHDAIDRLHRDVLDGNLPSPGPPAGQTSTPPPCSVAGAEVADALHAAGRTGRAAFWVNARAELLGKLDAWLAYDRIGWSGRVVRASEQEFGVDERVELLLPNGRAIGFRGSGRPHRRVARRHARRHRPQDGQAGQARPRLRRRPDAGRPALPAPRLRRRRPRPAREAEGAGACRLHLLQAEVRPRRADARRRCRASRRRRAGRASSTPSSRGSTR